MAAQAVIGGDICAEYQEALKDKVRETKTIRVDVSDLEYLPRYPQR